MADVKLNVKVNDREVVAADKNVQHLTSSYQRLKAESSNISSARGGSNPFAGIDEQAISRLKTNGATAEKVVKDVASAMKTAAPAADEMATASGAISEALAAINSAAGLAATGVGAFVAVIAAGADVFAAYVKICIDAALAYADFNRNVAEAQKETALHAETLSALHAQAQLTNTDWREINASQKTYISLIGDANAGSKEAQARLAILGTTGSKAAKDLDQSYRETIATIANLPTAAEQARAATAAFGEEGAKSVLPFIKEFKGDIPGLISKMKEYGVVVGEDDVKGTKEFDKIVNEFWLTIKGFGITIGRETLPVLKEFFGSFNSWLQQNKGEIASWAKWAAEHFQNFYWNARTALAVIKDLAVSYSTGTVSTINTTTLADEYAAKKAEAERQRLNPTVAPSSSENPLAFIGTGDKAKKEKSNSPSIDQILEAMRKGTMAQESGGRQSIRNTRTNATGLFQVMPANIPSFTKEALGFSMSQSEFSASKSAQIAVFQHVMGGYLKRAMKDADGNWEVAVRRAAASWYGGEDNAKDYAANWGGKGKEPTFNQYTSSVLRRTKAALGMKGDYMDKIGDELIDFDNKEFAKAQMERMKKFYDIFSSMPVPDEVVKRYTDFLNKDVKRDRDKLDPFDVRQKYFARKEGPLTTNTTLSDTPLAMDKTTSSNVLADILQNAPNYLKKLQKTSMEGALSKGLFGDAAQRDADKARLAEIADFQDTYLSGQEESVNLADRERALIAAKAKHYEIVNLLVADQKQTQLEQFDSLSKQLEVQEKLYGDEAFQKQAREISVLQEKIGLQRENFDLETKIATLGENAAERYRNAWLRAIYEVRDANIRAVEEQIAAQVKIENQSVFSADQVRAKVLSHLAEQKTINDAVANGIIKIYDTAIGKVESMLDRIGIGKVPILGDILKFNAQQGLSKATTRILDAILPGSGAKFEKAQNPQLGELKEHTNYLKQIAANTRGAGGGSGSSSGGGIIQSILSGISGSGISSGGNPISYGSGGTPSLDPGSKPMMSGGIFDRIKGIFSTQDGGLFAPQGGSKAAGVIGGIGSIASLAGGLIGGRAGGILSGIGGGISTGISIGAMFGPAGALAGAVIGGIGGFFASLFGGDPKKKADKNQNLPALRQGFGDSITELNKILSDLRQLKIDPDSAVSKAGEVRAQIASGFGIQFQSKKYRKQAQNEIRSQLGQADTIIDQIKQAADIARASGDRSKRIIGEFASGGSIFPKPGGHLAVVGEGGYRETILTDDPRYSARSLGLLNSYIQRNVSDLGLSAAPARAAAPQVNVQPIFNLEIHGAPITEEMELFLTSDKGERIQINNIKKFKEEKSA